MTAPSKCSGPDKLPLDALYEILLRLPAKELCRLRIVCRPWRTLLCDPHFIAAHAACHPEPLIVACHIPDRNSSSLFDIMDLSGQVLKRFHKIGDPRSTQRVISTQLDLVCITKGGSCFLHNPATGSLFALPQGYAAEHSVQDFALGQVASTAQYKVLRLINRSSDEQPWCEVFTLDGASDARWGGKKVTPGDVDLLYWSIITIQGVVYFLLCLFPLDPGPIHIASFDLGTEDWRANLQGPVINGSVDYDDVELTSLNGCLVFIHGTRFHGSSMDLWFLMDFEKGLWVKQYSIQHKMSVEQGEVRAYPFLVLSDGRILTYIGIRGLLRIYDPRDNTYTDVADIGPRDEIGLYTGNLLSLPNDASGSAKNCIQ